MRQYLFIVGVSLLGCQSGSGQPAPGAPPSPVVTGTADLSAELEGAPGRIVFVERRGEAASSLVALRPNGAPADALPPDPEVELFPADGPVPLAVASWGGHDDHREQLAVSDGRGGWKRVGQVASKVRNPSISADGSWVVYESDSESFRDIYRVELATGKVSRLTRDGDGAFDPSLRPDGAIAFVSTLSGEARVHVMAADGSARKPLIEQRGHAHTPRWSPSGDRLAFVGDRDGAERLFVASADGRAVTRLTKLAAEERHESDPVWSPDGRRLAYLVHFATGPRELWVADLAAGTQVRVSPEAAHVDHASWSPDSRFLVYDDGAKSRSLMVARADGTARRTLVSNDAEQWLARWRR